MRLANRAHHDDVSLQKLDRNIKRRIKRAHPNHMLIVLETELCGSTNPFFNNHPHGSVRLEYRKGGANAPQLDHAFIVVQGEYSPSLRLEELEC